MTENRSITQELVKILDENVAQKVQDEFLTVQSAAAALDRLQKQLKQRRDRAETLKGRRSKLTDDITRLMSAGKSYNKQEAALREVKRDLESEEEWAERLENEVIPKARADLELARKRLRERTETAMRHARDQFANPEINRRAGQVIAYFDAWNEAARKIYGVLGLALLSGNLEVLPVIDDPRYRRYLQGIGLASTDMRNPAV
jgi:type I site-specific restriction endonuclease